MRSLCCIQVWYGRLNGIAANRGRTVRHSYHHCKPCFFRTELLTEESTKYADQPIHDYDEGRRQQMKFWKGAWGQQSGDVAKLAQALLTIAGEDKPPLLFIAGADAVQTADQVSDILKK